MTAVAEGRVNEVGQARRRREDAHLITGQTLWTDNVTLPGMLHLAILRSPVAHATITKVDVSAARERPGVVAAFSGADLAGDWGPLPMAWTVSEDQKSPPHFPLTADKVRFVGDGVAVVAATSREGAVDALDAIDFEFETLPAVVDMEAAVGEGSALVYDDVPANRCFTWRESHGDYAAAKDRAEVVLNRRFINQRLIPSAMEPRSVVVQPSPATGEYTMWSSTQVPHFVQIFISLTAGVPQSSLRVIAPDVGGGFGSKLDVYAEEAIGVVLAKKLGVPVKWTETRSENYQVTIHGRDLIQDAEIAAMRDGTVLGLKVDLTANMGGYLQLLTTCIPLLGRYMYPGIYKFEAHDLSCTGVFTNTTPTDAYRGAGRPEATYVIERIMDELAYELSMDPLGLRRKNWIQRDEFPYTTVCGLEYDSGDYEKATARATELLGYDELRREQQARRDRNDHVQIGIGVSTYTEMCGLAPSRWLGQKGYIAGGWEAATVRVLPLGKVEVVTGTSPHGQGHETTFAQIAADALGVSFDDIVVVHGDTRTAPLGLDTYGSRSLAVGGIAILKACEKIVEKARVLAAHQLECDPSDLEFSAGTFAVRGSPDAAKTIQELAFASFVAHDLPDGANPILTADAVLDPETFSFPHGTHLAHVEVDTETGGVDLKKYVAVDDVGKVVNPLVVEGQVHGGVAQGIAQALFEEAVYDAEGNLVTGTMVDYLVPSAADLPSFTTDRTETPSTTNPLGVKGVGEAGTIASTPAVVNAVVDALRPRGVNDVQMPCTPMHVWQAMEAAKGEPR
ncbi:MAG TPA: xanthine dehydrogenase family protein molybdopterin-binding subunit [Jiangellaceae bacterium]|nr:xanthine dehydrogenase family protein molybdopterin-binding subunit [Jiangellaceae bacterium]